MPITPKTGSLFHAETQIESLVVIDQGRFGFIEVADIVLCWIPGAADVQELPHLVL
jgi:hypothetical protein